MGYRGGGGGGRGCRQGDRPRCPPPSTPRSVPIARAGPCFCRGTGARTGCYRWQPMPATPKVPLSPSPAPSAAVPVTTSTMDPPPSSASVQSAPASSALQPAALAKEAFISAVSVTAQGTTATAADEASSYVDLAPLSRMRTKRLARPARPGRLATVGEKRLVRANDFLLVIADSDLYHYDEVASDSDSNSNSRGRELVNDIIKVHGKTALRGKLTAYDGRNDLCTAGSLPLESQEFAVILVDSDEEKERTEKEYKITIRFPRKTNLHQLNGFWGARQRNMDVGQGIIHAFDILIKNAPYWKSPFSTASVSGGDIGEGLECWKGHYQSICPKLMGVSLSPRIEAFLSCVLNPLTLAMKFAEEFLSLCETSHHLSDRHHVRLQNIWYAQGLKDIASRLAWRFKKFSRKMITCHLSDAIKKVHSRLARKLLNANCKENVSTPPIISRPRKELVVQCPQTAPVAGIDYCWWYPSPQPDIIITRPIAVKYYRSLDQILDEIKTKFNYVVLPENLRKPTMRHNFVSFLSSISQNLVHQLLVTVCREGHEVRNVCWHGAFELSDIWLSEGQLKMNPYLAYSQYSEEGGRKDYKKMYQLIFSAFRDPVTNTHPCLLDSLLDLLDKAPEAKRRDHDFITYLINHPCLLSYTDRLKVFFVLEKMIEKLKPPYSHVLEQLLSKNSGWGSIVEDIEELKDAYYYGSQTDAAGNPTSMYGKGLKEAFRFARNFLNHTRSTVKSLKEAEAALCFVLPSLMHTVVLLLLLCFQGPAGWDLMAVISMKNADRTEVQFGWDWVEAIPINPNKKPRVE